MAALYSLCEYTIIYLTIWLSPFRILYYKGWFKATHSFMCAYLTWLPECTTRSGASWPLHLLLPPPETFFTSSLITWLNPAPCPAVSTKVLSLGKALWLPDRPCLPVTSSRGLSCPSPSSVSFNYCPSPLQTVHGVKPSRNPGGAYQPLLADGYCGLYFSLVLIS